MKTVKDDELINTTEETEALFEYTRERWEGISGTDLRQVLEHSFNSGLHAARFWIKDFAFSDLYRDWTEARKDPKKWGEKGNDKDYMDLLHVYDDVNKIGYCLLMGGMTYKDTVQKGWEFSKEADRVSREVNKLVPQASKCKPKGWDTLRQGYSDHDGGDEYYSGQHIKDAKDFKGIDSSGHGASGFHNRIVLHHTMYADVCQGRSPLRTLSSSAFAHGLAVAAHNNTAEMLNELKELKEKYLAPEYFNEITYLGDMAVIPRGKILKAFFIAATHNSYKDKEYDSQETLNDFMASMLKLRKESNLNPETEEEKEARINNLTKELMAELKSPEDIERRKLEELDCEKAMLAVLEGEPKKLKI